MNRIRKSILVSILIASTLVTVFIVVKLSRSSIQLVEDDYDERTSQKAIYKHEKIDSVLSSLPEINYSQLDATYTSYSDPDKSFEKHLRDKTYRIVKGDKIFSFIVGKYRIKDFLSKDKYYDENLENLENEYELYWLIDSKLLHWTLSLMEDLETNGYDPNAFSILKGHRHPLYNAKVGGASKSRHIFGQAMDILIDDINKDGIVNYSDKSIVLDILERKIVKNKGGIGRYPNSMVIHYDTRGYRARWNSY